WKCARPDVFVEVLLLDIHMMELREVRLPVVESVRCRGGAEKDPSPKDRGIRQLQPPLRVIDDRRSFLRLRSSRFHPDDEHARAYESHSSNDCPQKLLHP